MNVKIGTNKKALSTVRNKKKELKNLDKHAWESDNETGSNVIDEMEQVNELEDVLDQSKESMYKLSYVIRVSASNVDELKQSCDEVKDFYDDLNVKLVRPFGDMIGLHSEFIPASKRYMKDRKSTRLNSSHVAISYAVFCLKKKTNTKQEIVSY